MNKSESISNLAMALCKFQGEIENPKNTANNPFFKSKYAPLSEVINTARPILFNNGLSILQSPSGDGEHIIITTLLMHSSGEWIEGEPLILKADKPTAQGAGSAITYGRRYALTAILGIASEEDDDGNSATGNKAKATTTAIGKTTEPEGNTSTTGNVTNLVCSGCGNTINQAIVTFSEKKFGKSLCMGCQKKEGQTA